MSDIEPSWGGNRRCGLRKGVDHEGSPVHYRKQATSAHCSRCLAANWIAGMTYLIYAILIYRFQDVTRPTTAGRVSGLAAGSGVSNLPQIALTVSYNPMISSLRHLQLANLGSRRNTPIPSFDNESLRTFVIGFRLNVFFVLVQSDAAS